MDEKYKKLIRDRLLIPFISATIMQKIIRHIYSGENQERIIGITERAIRSLKKLPVSSVEYNTRVIKLLNDLKKYLGAEFLSLYDSVIKDAFSEYAYSQVELLADNFDIDDPEDRENTVNSILAGVLFAGLPLSEWYSKLPDTLAESLAKSGVESISSEAPVDYDSIFSKQSVNQEMFVRSALTGLAEAAISTMFTPEMYEEIYVAIMDSRTTYQCADLNGKRFKLNTGPVPPLHRFCRSQRFPILKKDRLVLPSFKEWLNSESLEFQRAYLGPTRFDAWKTGEITLSDFVSPDYKTYTIKELKRMKKL